MSLTASVLESANKPSVMHDRWSRLQLPSPDTCHKINTDRAAWRFLSNSGTAVWLVAREGVPCHRVEVARAPHTCVVPAICRLFVNRFFIVVLNPGPRSPARNHMEVVVAWNAIATLCLVNHQASSTPEMSRNKIGFRLFILEAVYCSRREPREPNRYGMLISIESHKRRIPTSNSISVWLASDLITDAFCTFVLSIVSHQIQNE